MLALCRVFHSKEEKDGLHFKQEKMGMRTIRGRGLHKH